MTPHPLPSETLHWQIPPSKSRPGLITVHHDSETRTFTARLWSGSDVLASSCGHGLPSEAVDELLALWREELTTESRTQSVRV